MIIAERLAAHSDKILVTHAAPEAYRVVAGKIPDAVYNPVSRTIVVNRQENVVLVPGVAVVTGGTATCRWPRSRRHRGIDG